MKQLSLDSQITSGAIQLGRGNIISSKDIAAKPGDYPIYSSSAQGKGEFGRYADFMFDEELITWSVDGGGRFFFRSKHKFSVTNVCGYMRVDDNIWNRRFVYYTLDLQHANMAFDYQMKAHPSVIRKIYTFGEVPKPEKTKIAEILSTVDRAIEQTEALIAKQQRLKTGLMQDLLTRGIDEHGNLRSEQTHKFKDSPLGRIPVEWEVTPAKDLCDAVIDCKNRTPPAASEGHPVIRTPNVRNGEFVLDGLAWTDPHSYEVWVARGKPRAGDVVITREAPFGEACQIPADLPAPCLGQRMMMYQTDPEKLRPDYLVFAIHSEAVQSRLLELAGGSTVGHVRVGDIRSLSIPHPVSVIEQARITSALSGVTTTLKKVTANQLKLCSLKTALMQDLLTGRKRVTELLSGKEIIA